jgi:hypothetical protein
LDHKIRRLGFSNQIKTLTFFLLTGFICEKGIPHDDWKATEYSAEKVYAPTPLPDRVVLTWEGDPATTQSVTWRTDASVLKGVAHLAIANSNGRAMKTTSFDATTTHFKSDINDAHYHSVTFQDLEPDTLYAYRVGDGVNLTEYYHFKTASRDLDPFSFIYFGDAQNEVRTHWSRVFREAFRDAPRAAFTLHAGDLVDRKYSDAEWGEWHQGPDWVNGTIPVIATPGNHEYYHYDSTPELYWSNKSGDRVEVQVTSSDEQKGDGGKIYKVSFVGPEGVKANIEFNDAGDIMLADAGVESISGFLE